MNARLLMLVFIAAATACAGNQERTGYTIEFTVTGSAAAWGEVSAISVQDHDMDVPTVSGPTASTTAFLCTADQQRFLDMEQLAIRVVLNDGTVRESTVERLACRFSEDPGAFEYVYVRIREDGSIDSNYEQNDPDIYTSCGLARPWLCPVDEL